MPCQLELLGDRRSVAAPPSRPTGRQHVRIEVRRERGGTCGCFRFEACPFWRLAAELS